MVLPKKFRRGRPALRERMQLSRDWLYRLERLLEAGQGGTELLPAAEYLALIAVKPLSETARQRAAEGAIGRERALEILRRIGEDMIAATPGFSADEVRRLQAKLEKRVMGWRFTKRPFGKEV